MRTKHKTGKNNVGMYKYSNTSPNIAGQSAK